VFNSVIIYSQNGYALFVGLSTVDNAFYSSKYKKQYGDAAVAGVPSDIAKMKYVISETPYELTILTDKQATNKAVLNKLREIGQKIKPDDTFLFYFSGHGDTVKDVSGDELFGYDQVFVTYNDYLLDDSIHVLFKSFFAKSKNVMIVDACHSGSSFKSRNLFFDLNVKPKSGKEKFKSQKEILSVDPLTLCSYASLNLPDEPYPLIYFGAVSDDKTAMGFPTGGLLTSVLYRVYDTYSDPQSEPLTYQKLACEISNQTKRKNQIMQYHEIGNISEKQKKQQPFKLK